MTVVFNFNSDRLPMTGGRNPFVKLSHREKVVVGIAGATRVCEKSGQFELVAESGKTGPAWTKAE